MKRSMAEKGVDCCPTCGNRFQFSMDSDGTEWVRCDSCEMAVAVDEDESAAFFYRRWQAAGEPQQPDWKMLPCPFCGEEPHLEYDEVSSGGEVYVMCTGCGATGPFGANHAEALERWNSRGNWPQRGEA